MKTTQLNYSWRALGQAAGSRWATAAAVVSATLLWSASSMATSVTTISGGPSFGDLDGDTAQIALFHNPVGLALDKSENLLFVADRDNNAIRQLNLSANLTITFATYRINRPVGVAVDKAGNVFVLNHGDGSNGSVVEFDSFGDFLGTLASGLANANGMTMDAFDNLYLTVNGNTVIQISSAGIESTITTVPAAGAVLRGITVMTSGFLAVADSALNGIWLVDPSSGNVTTLTGFNGAGDHFGPKAYAKFNQPIGVAASGGGMVVVTDYGNNRVKVVDSTGTVTNLYGVNSSFWVTGAGTYPGWFDGEVCAGDINFNSSGCVEARLPNGVAFGSDGSVFTTEDYYHLIRKATGSSLPLPPAPPPPVPTPAVGWVDFTIPPAVVVSVLRTAQPFIFNNDVIIAIEGTSGTETHFTYGATPNGVDTIPDPSATVGSTPPIYFDGMLPGQVPPSIVPPQPDLTIKAIGTAPGRADSLIVAARFQFKVANPLIIGTNAAQFSVTNQTINAQMYYTIDGSDPVAGAPSLGPITAGTTLDFNINSDLVFKIRGFRSAYQPSDIVTFTFTTNNFVPNSISFGFPSGEASSDFVAAPGQFFYAPVTLNVLPSTAMYSLQFNLTVTNAGPNPGPAVAPGAFSFQSMLEKPDLANPGLFVTIPPAMFLETNFTGPTVPANAFPVFHGTNPPSWFETLTFTNSSLNLMGVGWLERRGETNLYDTRSQDLIQFSQAHDTQFKQSAGQVVLGGYAFRIPPNAVAGQTYRIQIGQPSATSDGIGMPGSSVYIATPTNGSLAAGPINSIKIVSAGQRKYLAGDSAPFRWFNAGDFGDTNLDSGDVMQVFQSAVYGLNFPPLGSDFFDSMDSCGRFYTQSPNGYLVPAAFVSNPNALFDGNDTTINQIAFGDGVLDVCDVYVTFRRSLDPSVTLFRRFWTNGVLGAEALSAAQLQPTPALVSLTNPPSLSFASADFIASAGQTVQVPITAQTLGDYPLRVAMISLSIKPLDGSPELTTPIQFTPSSALGQPAITFNPGNSTYAATWLNSTIAGVKGTATLGTLKITVPAGAATSAAYAIHFDHASGSPNGLASFPKRTVTGLVTLADRSTSTYGDSIPDSWRLRYFGTVNNLLSQADADADGDGASNWQEYVAGTDPTDAASVLRASATANSVISWPSIVGKHYVIERSASLFNPNWTPIATLSGTGANLQYQDTTGGTVQFYRVSVAQ